MNRRDLLRSAIGAGTVLAAFGAKALLAEASEKRPRLVIVLFGGGTRSSESIDDPEHRYIPRLWQDMVPRGTLFTNMRVEHKVVHPNSAGSIVTGHWEWDDIDWTRPVANPTVFEIYRKARSAPDSAVWAFVYASILAKTGASSSAGYGASFGADVVVPPTIPREAAEEMDKLLRTAAATGSSEAELAAAEECAKLARSTSRISVSDLRSERAKAFVQREYAVWKTATGSTSHDLFLTDRAIACMKEFSPEVIYVAYGEIDCAHYGSWSRYTEAIKRTDELTWRLWRATEELPDYRGRTLFLVLPDHGRELEREGGAGFVHHSDFYTNTGVDEGCRRVWMLATGPAVTPGRKLSAATPITCVAATGLEHLGLKASPGAAKSVLARMR